jgi:uncharacterized protein YceK
MLLLRRTTQVLMRHRTATIWLALTAACISGCSTVLSKGGDIEHGSGWGHPYSGTSCSIKFLNVALSPPYDSTTIWMVPLALLNVPLSFVADTVLVPVDIFSMRGASEGYGCIYIS